MVKISQLPPDAAPTSDDSIPMYDPTTGLTKRITLTELSELLFAQATSVYQELARVTLGVAGDTLSATGLPNRKYIHIEISLTGTGTVTGVLRFNGDSGNNYAYRASYSGAADIGATTQSSIALYSEAGSQLQIVIDIINISTKKKLVYATLVSDGGAGVGTNTVRGEISGKWENVADAISQIDLINTNTGDFAIGAQMVISGHD